VNYHETLAFHQQAKCYSLMHGGLGIINCKRWDEKHWDNWKPREYCNSKMLYAGLNFYKRTSKDVLFITVCLYKNSTSDYLVLLVFRRSHPHHGLAAKYLLPVFWSIFLSDV